jgi:hypothetical protein
VGTTIIATISPSVTATICAGSAITFTSNTGTGLTYQWYKNGAAVSGATSFSYATSSSGSYSVLVTQNGACSGTSTATTLNVTNNPSPSITALGATTFCAGQNVRLRANSYLGVTYQWQNNGTDIVGATGRSYYASATGNYRVRETYNSCAKTSTSIAVLVNCRVMGGGNSNGQTGAEAEVNASDDFTLMPNPATSETRINYNAQQTGVVKAFMRDVMGRTVKQFDWNMEEGFNSYTIDVSQLPKGVYLLEISDSKQMRVAKRLVVN